MIQENWNMFESNLNRPEFENVVWTNTLEKFDILVRGVEAWLAQGAFAHPYFGEIQTNMDKHLPVFILECQNDNRKSFKLKIIVLIHILVDFNTPVTTFWIQNTRSMIL